MEKMLHGVEGELLGTSTIELTFRQRRRLGYEVDGPTHARAFPALAEFAQDVKQQIMNKKQPWFMIRK